ncbi:hypothetical protein Tco_0386801 [Tanacetum coccineum]
MIDQEEYVCKESVISRRYNTVQRIENEAKTADMGPSHLPRGTNQVVTRGILIIRYEGSVHTGIWGWRYRVYTQRSLNTLTQIVVKGILVADELQRVNSSGSGTLD